MGRAGLGINMLARKAGAVAYFGDRSHFYLNGGDPVGKPVWLSWGPDAAVLLSR